MTGFKPVAQLYVDDGKPGCVCEIRSGSLQVITYMLIPGIFSQAFERHFRHHTSHPFGAFHHGIHGSIVSDFPAECNGFLLRLVAFATGTQ
jgi:hypothetical protein